MSEVRGLQFPDYRGKRVFSDIRQKIRGTFDMAKLMKSNVVDSIVEATGLSKKDANAAVDAFAATICEALSNGDSVGLIGFGTFEAKLRPARTGRNPQTGDPIDIPEKTVPVFKAGKKLRDAAA